MAANLVRGKLAAVFLGPAGVGVYNQLSLSYNVAALAGSLASNTGVIQHGSESLSVERSEFARLISTLSLAFAASSVVVAGIALACAGWISELLLNDGGRHWREVALLMVAVPVTVFATLYRGLLGADQAVRDLVRVQIWSELGGMILFAGLLLGGFGLWGALVGYLSVQVISLIYSFAAASRRFGGAVMRPRVSQFRWNILQSILAFGASGFVMAGLSNLTLIVVNRMVIGAIDLASAGLLANAVRLSNVYLGAVTGTALNYYLPAVTRLSDPVAVGEEVARVVRFYCLILPPIMAGIIALAPWLVPLLFSPAFLPVVSLVAILVPSELARILGESMAVPLIARRRLVPHTLLFVLQTILFVGLVAALVPRFGLMGAATAYAIAVTTYFAASWLTMRKLLNIRIARQVLRPLLSSTMFLTGVAVVSLSLEPITAVGVSVVLGLLWAAPIAMDRRNRELLGQALSRLRTAKPNS